MIKNNLILTRFSYTDTHTFGVIHDAMTGIPICVTLERPNLGNERNISCIPCGTYKCNDYSSRKFKNAYSIEEVPDRDNILIHCGSFVSDSSGCILIGTSFGIIDENPAILHSRIAMKKLKGLFEFGFNLQIIDTVDTGGVYV